MRRTGVFATPEEFAKIQELAREAHNTPVMLIAGLNVSQIAWEKVYEAVDAAAEAHGLPKTIGHYGMLEDSEFWSP